MKPWSQKALSECQSLIGQIRGTADPVILSALFKELIAHQPLVGLDFGPGSIFWRALKCPDISGFPNYSRIWYPPADKATVGRLNEAGHPMLYLASRRFTAFSEIGAEDSQYVHLVGCCIRPDKVIRIGFIGDAFHIYRTGRSQILSSELSAQVEEKINSQEVNVARSVLFVDAFLGEVLATPSEKLDSYLLTRILFRTLINKDPKMECYFYPSTQQKQGMNLVVAPHVADQSFEIVSSSVVEIHSYRQYGMFDFSHRRNCISIGKKGDFVWEDAKDPREYIALGSLARRVG